MNVETGIYMKKSHNLWVILLLLVSCRQEMVVPDGAEHYPVTFNLPAVEVLTRAEDGDALATGATLTIAAYDPDTKEMVGASRYVVMNAEATGLELATDASPLYLPAGTYDFCAMAPQQTLSDGGRAVTIGSGVDALGSVTHAQMQAAPTAVTLNNLKHLASQVSFTVRVVATNSPVTEFKVIKIVVDGMVEPQTGNYKLPENEWIMPLASETDKFGELVIDNTDGDKFDCPENAPEGKSGKFFHIQKEPSIVFPKAAATLHATLSLKVGIDNGTAEDKTVRATINNLAFEPGKRYLFEVNYGWDFTTFTVKTVAWTQVDNPQGEVGSGEQEIGNNTFTVDEWGNLIDLGGIIG